MHYTPEDAAEIESAREAVSEGLQELWLQLAHDFAPFLTVVAAQEYVGQGICRRLKIIRRCINNIFDIVPVDRKHLLSEDERSDVAINLHAFIINSHGLPDNLAWVYVLEKGVEKRRAGKPPHVGLFNETNKLLPKEVRDYLNSEPIRTWHENYAKNYRDALAHRIPPYVPPSVWSPPHEQRYRALHEEISNEVKKGNFDPAQTLTDEQEAIGSICPAFLHSFLDTEACSPIHLHPQLIADTRTVIENYPCSSPARHSE